MKKELIQKLHRSLEDCAHEKDGVEFWLARELQELLGYTQWRNFEEKKLPRQTPRLGNAG
jgi:DNA-damage-inducible protein D